MEEQNSQDQNSWNEETSRVFINYGQYIIPQRTLQLQIVSSLMQGLKEDCQIVDLCCGEGVLAEMLLENKTEAIVYGLDGSTEMLRRAAERLSRFGGRFVAKTVELSEKSWRSSVGQVDAVVSSLAIHHLEGPQKQDLYLDIYRMLNKNGRVVIADLINPASEAGKLFAADMWDEAVKARSLEVDGSTEAYDFFMRERWNIFRYPDPEDIDKPSPLYEQLKWLEEAGFVEIDVHWMLAGHAIFGARKE